MHVTQFCWGSWSVLAFSVTLRSLVDFVQLAWTFCRGWKACQIQFLVFVFIFWVWDYFNDVQGPLMWLQVLCQPLLFGLQKFFTSFSH